MTEISLIVMLNNQFTSPHLSSDANLGEVKIEKSTITLKYALATNW